MKASTLGVDVHVQVNVNVKVKVKGRWCKPWRLDAP
jgi:hypothetical protein